MGISYKKDAILYNEPISGPTRIPGSTVTTADIGARVKRGPDWEFSNQDRGSDYGIIVESADTRDWVRVDWIKEAGPYGETKMLYSNTYRVGYDNKYDLVYF